MIKTYTWVLKIFLASWLLIGCDKQSATKTPETHCWQIVDLAGNKVNTICDKTAADMMANYPNSCNYYQLGGDTACYYIDSSIFLKNVTDFELQHYLACYHYGNVQKVDCGYCGRWYSRQKNIYKPANTVTYSAVRVKQFCGDTAYTLFQGREIILRETLDSLITIQFSSTGVF